MNSIRVAQFGQNILTEISKLYHSREIGSSFNSLKSGLLISFKKSGKLTNIGEKWETQLWFVIITCKFARISLNNISYGYLWCLTIEIIITIYWNIIKYFELQ